MDVCHLRPAALDLPAGLLTVAGDEPESLLDFFNKHVARTPKRRHPVRIYEDDNGVVVKVEIDFIYDVEVPETRPAAGA